MKTLLIVNPHSGTSRGKEHIVEAAREILPDLEVAYTEHRGHASELATDAARRGFEAVVAVGGDGTVNETARALCNTGVIMGVVPAGSGNGLARHLSIPMNPVEALKVVAEGRHETCDFCTANHKPFFCTFGVGFDAAVSSRFAATPDQRGLVNYVRSAVQEFVRFKPDKYTISTELGTHTERAFIVACCNASQYGNNAFIAPKASITDGLMDVTVVHKGTWLSHALSGLEIITGALHNSPRVHTFRSAHVTIQRPTEGPVHLDGEPDQMGTVIDVRCHPGGLKVFSPGELHVMPILTSLGIK